MKYKKMTYGFTHEIEDSVLTASEREASRMSFDFDHKWLMIFWIGSMIIVGILIFRSFYISVVKGDYYTFVASGNSVREVPIIAPRGKIYDTNGKILADNIPSRSIIVLPHLLSDQKHEREVVAKKLAEILGLDLVRVQTIIETAYVSGDTVLIEENITHEQALTFFSHESDLVGIQIQQTAIRDYKKGEKFAHIIGYEGLIKKEEYEKQEGYLLTDRIGKTGIEYEYEKYLHGKHGAEKVLVDSRGNRVKELMDDAPHNGFEVHLNIDADLQEFLYDRLLKELDRAESRRATAVIIDPRDGAVRALVSLPSYDNNKFAKGIDSETYSSWITDPDQPLFNRVVSGTYAPGSTVKPVMGIATLGENIISADHQIEGAGGLQLGSFFFGDWKIHGFTDLRKAIAVSSDVYFYTVGGGYGDITGLGIEKMKQYMERFGYGKKTGIDLPGEVSGIYPNKKWKEDVIGERWYIGNTYHASIGQGYILATALQVANSIVPIANGGTLYVPHIVSYITNTLTGERITINPEQITDNIAPLPDIKIIQEGMRQTVTEGTATMLNALDNAIAGKTGTAQFGGEEKVHSWFVSYAPYDNPEMVMAIMVENQTGELSSTTVPVAHDVYKWYFGGRTDDVFAEESLSNNQ
ncbi:MAG: penicillin-binding protein 2 [Candidatus Moraniibacteriota bacterium]|nr:MAG: penicillin-binding protein 2 [Candidatus Moranbacteria bacterium]